MVRTKSSGGRKESPGQCGQMHIGLARTSKSGQGEAVAEKAPRKVLASSSSGGGSSRSASTPKSGKSKYAGGAPACPRPTPEWQKDITTFFATSPKVQKVEADGVMAGGSSKPDPVIEEHKENVDANIDQDMEDAGGSSGSGSSQPCASGSSSSSFKKNGIISDSEDDD